MSYEAQTLFYQGAYEGCIASAANINPALVDSDPQAKASLLYAARAHLALNNPAGALGLLPSSSEHKDIVAVRTLATFLQDEDVEALNTLSELVEEAEGEDEDMLETIRICSATAAFKDDDALGALETLSAAQNQIECVALSVHILLSIHRPDLAKQQYDAARGWADDSLLIQLIEAWLGVSTGGRAAQQAYYVYDELAQNPSLAGSKNLVSVLVGKAAALAVQGKYAEADKVLADAAALDPQNAHVLANRAALAGHLSTTRAGDAAKDYVEQLRAVAPTHPLIRDLDEKTRVFDEAAASIAVSAPTAASA